MEEVQMPDRLRNAIGAFNLAGCPGASVLGCGFVDGSVVAWDPQSGKMLLDSRTMAVPSAIALTSTGRHLFAACADRTALLWNVLDGKQEASIVLAEKPYSAAIAPDGKTGVVGSWNGEILYYNIMDGKLLWSSKHSQGPVAVAIDDTGELIASGGADGTVAVFSIESGAMLGSYHAHSTPIVQLRWSRVRGHLALASAGGHDRTVAIWDWDAQRIFRRFKTDGYIQCFDVSPSEGVVAAGKSILGKGLRQGGGAVVIWELESGHLLRTDQVQDAQVRTVVIVEGSLVFSSGRTVQVARLR